MLNGYLIYSNNQNQQLEINDFLKLDIPY